MGQKVDFSQKVLSRLDRLGTENVQAYLSGLLQEKKENQEILDQIDEGVLLLRPEGVVKFANRRAFFWLGFERYLKNRSRISDLVTEPALRTFFLQCLKTPGEQIHDEFQVLTPREMTLRVHWVPLQGEGESVLVRVENLTEIRDRDEEEARLRRIESLIRLAAGVAHEIGNPVNSIQIHISLLKEEIAKLPANRQRPVSRLLRVLGSETKRLDQIVRSFLRATRNPPLRFKLDSLNEVLEEATGLLGPEMNRQKITLKLHLDQEIPPFLFDRDRLHQVLINLMKNGIEAMTQGGTLTITTNFKGKICLVQFQDEGKGIEKKDLPHIFEAYYTTKEEGSGLGLTQVYQTVHEHGGRIEVNSEVGKGSLVTLVLPVRRERFSLPQPQ